MQKQKYEGKVCNTRDEGKYLHQGGEKTFNNHKHTLRHTTLRFSNQRQKDNF